MALGPRSCCKDSFWLGRHRHVCAGQYLAAFLLVANNAGYATSSWMCEIPSEYSDAELLTLIKKNCDRVNRSSFHFDRVMADDNSLSAAQRDLWVQKQNESRALCTQAENTHAIVTTHLRGLNASARRAINASFRDDLLEAAASAVNAWGAVIMEGRQCCVAVEGTWCESSYRSRSGLVLFIFLIFVVCLVAVSSAVTAFRPSAPVKVPEPPAGASASNDRGATAADFKQKDQRSSTCSSLSSATDKSAAGSIRTSPRPSLISRGQPTTGDIDAAAAQSIDCLAVGPIKMSPRPSLISPRDGEEPLPRGLSNASSELAYGQSIGPPGLTMGSTTVETRSSASQISALGSGLPASLSPRSPRSASHQARRSTIAVAMQIKESLRQSLEDSWLQGYCLRVLPGASDFARSSASLLSSLRVSFEFQQDNVRNQHEHLLSLWRSHVALVADRPDSDMPVNSSDLEERLLGKALADIHADLLDGFVSWRAKLRKHLPISVPSRDRAALPLLGGCRWQEVSGSACGADTTPEVARELSVQLSEIVTYLLIWGEAGNLRFMPEVVYFLTELALSADRSGLSPYENCNEDREEDCHKSGLFLSKIIRPIYNVIFDEWYEHVEVEKKKDNKWHDKKKIRAGFEAFLPPDAANYDDWDELFCDPERLARTLRLNNGKKLFDLPHAQRFAALPQVDWQASLDAVQTKTHREIHSLWGVFASTHRVWLLHAVLFLCSVCWIAEEPAPVQGQDGWGRFAAVGLIVPVHTMLWLFARWQVTGHAFRVSRFRSLYKGRRLLTIPLCISPLVTYAALREVGSERSFPSFHICLAVHYVLSSLGFFLLVLKPGSRENLWTPTAVPIYRRVIRYTFWCCVLVAKFSMGLMSIGVMHLAVKGLDLTEAGHELPRDLTSVFNSMAWASNPFLWCLMWSMSFLLYIADTQLWFVIGCTIMGVAVVFSQRHWQFGKFILEDAVSKIPERFSRKVFTFAPAPKSFQAEGRRKEDRRLKRFSPCFPLVWDRIMEHLRYEDHINNELLGDLTFTAIGTYHSVTWEDLKKPLGHAFFTGSVNKNEKMQRPLCASGCGRHTQIGLARNGLPHTYCCTTCEMYPGEHDQTCTECQAIEQEEQEKVEENSSLSVAAVAMGAIMRSIFGRDETPRERQVKFPDESPNTLDSPQTLGRTSPRGEKSRATRRSRGLSERRVHVPEIFRPRGFCENFFKHYCNVADSNWPQNPDVQWRIIALARSLSLPMPRPFRAPHFPGLTVLIPHYGESILMKKEELYPQTANISDTVPLIDWVKYHWKEEFSAFTTRMQSGRYGEGWPLAGSQWNEYTTEHWDKLNTWCSMRMQTLWRTVSGMCMYHSALQCHYEAQVDRGDDMSKLAYESVWDPSDCFTCLVSMQMYKYFDQTQLDHTNRMFDKFPDCLKVAFIDYEDKGRMATDDFVHERQQRRYFSCLIDKKCTDVKGRKKPRFRIELPGYPILGDGKGDNQNHAIPFMRGSFAQCIDANQGAYFEQMLLLPCVLGEFRSRTRGDGGAKRIIGLPEHITSTLGSVGDMAAASETAFGTILQRTYAVLGARMHYGHPDIMNKSCMMQQGGVSKATKTLNLSEDIFAGMDFTLRGEGRDIRHCEYFNLTKGRDLGFNSVLGFFSKLSSGAGEQILTRQMFRLGQIFHLPEFLTFYYAHVGYYFTQFFISWSLPGLMYVWLVVLLSDCDSFFDVFQTCVEIPVAETLAKALSVWLSWLLLLFLIATSLPFFAELWMERSFKTASLRVVKQFCTLSPLLFIFQSKVIGHYVVNEVLVGGATYVATGRSLPTERRPFIGQAPSKGCRLDSDKVGGLYLDYAKIAFYDGSKLLAGAVLIAATGGAADAGNYSNRLTWTWLAIALQIASWLYAPFIFNPYQFVYKQYIKDLRVWWLFFTEDGGKHWQDWYEKTHLKLKDGCRSSLGIVLIGASFCLTTWCWTVLFKVEALASIYSESAVIGSLRVVAFLPPVGASFVYCLLASIPAEDESIPDEGDLENGRLPAAKAPKCCATGLPLAFSAALVLMLDVCEATLALYSFFAVGWTKAFAAGIILKYVLLSCCLNMAEDVTRLQRFDYNRRLGKTLAIWVRAHRMCRDLVTSSLILGALVPLVLLTSLNSAVCSGCSAHNLLLYRDPGHFRRAEVRVYRDNSRSKSFFSRATSRVSRVSCGRTILGRLTELLDCAGCCRRKMAGSRDRSASPSASPATGSAHHADAITNSSI